MVTSAGTEEEKDLETKEMVWANVETLAAAPPKQKQGF